MVEGKRLDRDQRLIVIHAQSGVEARPRGFVKHGIGGKRASRVDTLGNEHGDGGGNDGAVLIAEHAGFACMRIEASNRQPGPGETEAQAQIAGNNSSGLDDEFGRKLFEYFSKRQMDRHRDHRQFRRPQHHHRPQYLA